jgi:hypothetical protein
VSRLLAFLSFSFSHSDFPSNRQTISPLFLAPKHPFNSPELFAATAAVLKLRRQPADLVVGVIVLLPQRPHFPRARLDILIQCRIFRIQVVVLRLEVPDLRFLPVEVVVYCLAPRKPA